MIFEVKDCSLVIRMAGVKEALNLRELEERLMVCPDESLFHHFCETVIRPTFDYPDYTNDFALWVGQEVRDKVLAERLATVNPYKFSSFDELRQHVVDLISERVSDMDHIPWAPRSRAFQFLQAVTVVFDTGSKMNEPGEFLEILQNMSLGSIYYHFVEARRRTEGSVDDFSAWLADFGEETEPLIHSLSEIDFYFMSLPELRKTLVDHVSNAVGVTK